MRNNFDAIIIGSGAAAYSCADWLYKENITNIGIDLSILL
jgi:thioredoxin reductase